MGCLFVFLLSSEARDMKVIFHFRASADNKLLLIYFCFPFKIYNIFVKQANVKGGANIKTLKNVVFSRES
ncbi:MAG TPA: hypothetical protein DCX32_03855 [Candidatus Moranbacteria bacterium]|nr:hypothetical protein [Candidatus Moranbacteria bacterium]